MVAHLLSLKWRLLVNGFKRSTWQLVGTIIGGLYALFWVVMLGIGSFYLAEQPLDLRGSVGVLVTSVVLLGWALIPVFLTGVDLTLDPARFNTFVLTRRDLSVGLLLSGFIGIPATLTLLVFLSQTLMWRPNLAAMAAAIISAILAALMSQVLSRLVSTAALSITANRRFRDIAAVLLFIPLMLLGPAISSLADSFDRALEWIPTVAQVLSWTPLGIFAAIPWDVAQSNMLLAALRMLISVIYLAVFAWIWSFMLMRSIENPSVAKASGKVDGLGIFSRVPATPWGAVTARALIYWLKDPRYAGSLVVVPLMLVIAWFMYNQSGSPLMVLWAGPVVFALMGFGISADVSYDSTAFSLHALSGMKGADDRWGRAIACALVALPLFMILSIGVPLILGDSTLIPALVGMNACALLASIGISSIASARYTYAVPLPGESPFKSHPGSGVRMAVTQMGIMLAMTILSAPAIGLLIAYSVTNNSMWAWVLLLVGLVLGAIYLLVGVRVGGKWLESRWPELMQATVRNR